MAQNAAGVLQESAAKEAIELRHDKEKDPDEEQRTGKEPHRNEELCHDRQEVHD
jgi:hypothetical protein